MSGVLPFDLQNVRRRRARRRAVYAGVVVFIGVVALALGAFVVGYRVWTPGLDVTDGRHDRGRNAIWLQHAWLGADDWFRREHKLDQLADFRDPANIQRLAGLLRAQNITDVFPHMSPANKSGNLPAVDHAQVERFLDAFAGFRVMPWTGGVVDKTCRIRDTKWRRHFVESIIGLLVRHPRFAGVHINIEPCESGNQDFLKLLDGLRQALPDRFLLSVAAYPPPLWWQPFREVHWDGKYLREVAQRADQLAVIDVRHGAAMAAGVSVHHAAVDARDPHERRTRLDPAGRARLRRRQQWLPQSHRGEPRQRAPRHPCRARRIPGTARALPGRRDLLRVGDGRSGVELLAGTFPPVVQRSALTLGAPNRRSATAGGKIKEWRDVVPSRSR